MSGLKGWFYMPKQIDLKKKKRPKKEEIKQKVDHIPVNLKSLSL